MRLGVAVSGGADSVALLRLLAGAASEAGLVLTVLHVHHGMREADAEMDAEFVAALAGRLGLAFRLHHVQVPVVAKERGETLEEAARNLRYGWFRELLAAEEMDAVATAHTLDDQAETVVQKLLRGAWTEGLGGIHPRVQYPGGFILRPLLEVRRTEIEGWLRATGQEWREDLSNRDTAFTRNRVRHELLPQMEGYNPQIKSQLAHMASIAREEEAYWETELKRILPGLVLPGRAVRGGGRAVSTHPDEGTVGMEVERLRALDGAMRRRVVRAAAAGLGYELNFGQTERLMALCEPSLPSGRARREMLGEGLMAERTLRELRLERKAAAGEDQEALPELELRIPGTLRVEKWKLSLTATLAGDEAGPATMARLRAPKPGDRVYMRYTHGPRPLKEIFERLRVDAAERRNWPLVEWQGKIVWMKDVTLEPDPSVPFRIMEETGEPAARKGQNESLP
ncbi:tRNA lysidine(34) synthetase TilS [Paracidobacterium acidisoli]|nr:tRNA lysidine(34) synthetase TilS [Paracidobacterium acidisoli]